jgi:hypothetical protein
LFFYKDTVTQLLRGSNGDGDGDGDGDGNRADAVLLLLPPLLAPCTKNCEHLAAKVGKMCNLQTVPLELICLQHYWIRSGCTSEGENYPTAAAGWTTSWSKSAIIHDFMAYASNARENKVQWILRNSTAVPNKWKWLGTEDSNAIDSACERPKDRSITLEMSFGTLEINLDGNLADGWFRHYGHNRTLWGEGPLVRK